MNISQMPNAERIRVKDAVLDAVTEALNVKRDTLSEETRVIEDLGADSMDVVTIMILLDSSLNVEIDADELPPANASIRWITDQLLSKITKKT